MTQQQKNNPNHGSGSAKRGEGQEEAKNNERGFASTDPDQQRVAHQKSTEQARGSKTAGTHKDGANGKTGSATGKGGSRPTHH
ncbi:MAG: hypothetical protein V4443_05000 [Pseudomonadota bacterium]